MEVRMPSKNTYYAAQERVGKVMKEAWQAEMKRQGRKKRDWQWKMNKYGKDIKAAVTITIDDQGGPDPTSAVTLGRSCQLPAHITACHIACKSYFCSKTYQELLKGFHLLANRSHRLIHNVTSNYAEAFMNVMAKTTAGKRIDYSQREGYHLRATSAALAYNVGAFWLPHVFADKSGNKIWEDTASFFQKENTRKKKNDYQQRGPDLDDINYGSSADPGAFSEEEIREAVQRRSESLQVSSEKERNIIERATVGQYKNELWKLEKGRHQPCKRGLL
ncbi:hypothetical protein FQR65_LT14188 [Abscondita terminalis]|nr:hypothetical protein FQR65_LT14188 [Abscondita terminalis]